MFVVRPMELNDLESVRRLIEQTEHLCFEVWETDDVLAAAIHQNAFLSHVAVWHTTGEAVGAVFLGTTGLRLYFHHLAVSPNCRRQGIGRSLVELAISNARHQTPVRRFVCGVRSNNEIALCFWQSLGFVIDTALDGPDVYLSMDVDDIS